MYRMAYRLCRKYIFDSAKSPVNISGTTKAEILKQLPGPTRSIFKKAQEEIFLLLGNIRPQPHDHDLIIIILNYIEKDAMQRFRSSKDYAIMIKFHLDSAADNQGENIVTSNSSRSTTVLGDGRNETSSKFQRVLSRMTSIRSFHS